MTKSARLALMLAILMPFTGYFLVKYFSKGAIHMPGRYFYDSVITKNENGKIITDTLWHKMKNVSFINQHGKTVSLDSLKGKIVVINTIFTRCAGICPRTTQLMKKLQNSFVNLDSTGKEVTKNANKFIASDSIIQFLSISIDPNYDSAHRLRKFGDRFGANYDNWWFVTGNRDTIYQFLLKELRANVADSVNVTPDFVHTDMFFLLDKEHVLRGFYHSLNEVDTVIKKTEIKKRFDSLHNVQINDTIIRNDTIAIMKDNTEALARLASAIPALLLEKDKKKPSVLRGYIPLLPIIIGGLALVFVVMSILNKKRKPGYAAGKMEQK